MGLVDELRGLRICIDTAPFIYFIEKNPKYLSMLRPFFAEINAGKIDALTSTITLLEVLVLPFKTKNEPQKRAHSPLLAAGLASESKNGKLPYGRRFPAACGGELQT